MKTFKTVVMSASVIALGAGAISPAFANSPRSNAKQVANIDLKAKDGIYFHVVLKNTSGNKNIKNINIKPTKSTMALALRGDVKCQKDKGTDFARAEMYFGRVTRVGSEVKATNALYNANYNPSFSEWTGVIHKWITEGGNGQPFVVPLSKVKNGNADLRFDPVAEFNKKMTAYVNNGGSKIEFLKKDQYLTVNRPVSMSGTCRESTGFGKSKFGSGYMTVQFPITIKYEGDPQLKSGIGSGPQNQQLQAKFMVTDAKVTPYMKNYVGQCPANLKFRVAIDVQGAGVVKYRLVSAQGAKGPVNSMSFTKNDTGYKVVDFTKVIGQAKGGKVKGFVQAPKQQGGIKGFAQAPSAKKNGSWKVEIVEPGSKMWAATVYSWKCLPKTPAGPGNIKAGNANPKPLLKLKAK